MEKSYVGVVCVQKHGKSKKGNIKKKTKKTRWRLKETMLEFNQTVNREDSFIESVKKQMHTIQDQ
jgi:hypothetical protein